MKVFYFLFIAFFIRIETNIQIKQNPILLSNTENPFVLSTTDDYYYVITKGKSLKINKESGDKETFNNSFINYLYIFDNSNKNYIYSYDEKKYYYINYNQSISFEEITVNSYPKNGSGSMIIAGSIAKGNEFIIYGYRDKYLMFSSKSQYYRSYIKIDSNKIIKDLSCKLIYEEYFICGLIINSNLEIFCLKYYINSSNSFKDSLELVNYNNENSLIHYNSISSFGLYDTDKGKEKLLCRGESSQFLQCKFLKIEIKTNQNKYDMIPLNGGILQFKTSKNFTEKNCNFSIFNSEYLFCCAINNYIRCYRINSDTYQTIKVFELSKINGDNSYLTIKSNIEFATFFFMNKNNNVNSVYEYYIYLPECENKRYDISSRNNIKYNN